MGERKSIFITGAASGLGRETARLFAAKGWFVGATDINAEGLDVLKAELGEATCYTAVHDVTDRAAWDAAVDGFSAAAHGRMDVFYNNAGIGTGGPFDEVSEAATAKTIAVNLQGVVHGIYACLPLLKATAKAHGQADIVNMGSASGMFGPPGLAIYGATKHAVRGLTDSLSMELQRYGVRVSELQPAFLDTAILDTVSPGDGSTGRDRLKAAGMPVLPASVASQAVWRIAHSAQPKVHYAIGWPARLLQIQARLTPKRLRRAWQRSYETGRSI